VPGPAEATRRIANAQGLDAAARALSDAARQGIGIGARANALHGVVVTTAAVFAWGP
jgi:hypothetical protein